MAAVRRQVALATTGLCAVLFYGFSFAMRTGKSYGEIKTQVRESRPIQRIDPTPTKTVVMSPMAFMGEVAVRHTTPEAFMGKIAVIPKRNAP